MTHVPPCPRLLPRRLAPLALAVLGLVASCVPPVRRDPGPVGRPEAVSLFGQPLYPPELPLETRQRYEQQLAEARAAYEANPNDADAIIWLGRRLAYLGRYREAIQVFSEGIKKHPSDARMYRHRGHRWITLRKFDRAVKDLRTAVRLTRNRPDQVEPDGLPNAQNVPLTTLQGNIWYHLGLAYYLRGEFARAASAFREDLRLAKNDDNTVAASDWLYMSLRRLGRDEEARQVLAPIRRDMNIIENQSYHRRLLMYRGELPPDSLLDANGRASLDVATQGYGVGNWYLVNGRVQDAEEVFWRVTSAENWAPFGYIAAEADLRRLTRDAARRNGQRAASRLQ
ncbi:MAG TPA: tetratricopeptide repeat protein [Longimicrobium sp.]|jgi:tetratricopeptide (TPR) repeat protein